MFHQRDSLELPDRENQILGSPLDQSMSVLPSSAPNDSILGSEERPRNISFSDNSRISLRKNVSSRDSSRASEKMRTPYISRKDHVYIEVVICERDGEQVCSKLYENSNLTTMELERKIIEKRQLNKSKWRLRGEGTDNEIILFQGMEPIGSFFDFKASHRNLLGGKQEQLQRFKLVSAEEYAEVLKGDLSEKRRSARERVINKNTNIHLTPDLTQGVLLKRGDRVKGWRQRYFVLCAHDLTYYASEERFLNNPVNLRAFRGTIDLREALEIRIPCGENGSVSEETPMTRLKSNIGEPWDGEFQIVTPERIWQLRVLPDEVNDQRDLIRWVRALHASLDYYANDVTPTIFECLDEIIESTAIEQNTVEDLLIDKYKDVVSVLAERDSRNHFLSYMRSTLPEISELISGYYENILVGKSQSQGSPDARSLLRTFVSRRTRDCLQLDNLTWAMQKKCRSLSMTLKDIHNIIGEIMRAPQIELLFENFLDSPEFRILIWHHKSKTCANGEFDEHARWPPDVELRLKQLTDLRKMRMVEMLENLGEEQKVSG